MPGNFPEFPSDTSVTPNKALLFYESFVLTHEEIIAVAQYAREYSAIPVQNSERPSGIRPIAGKSGVVIFRNGDELP